MSDPIYEIKDNPTYETKIRALQDSDPAQASTIFNPLMTAMINNTHAVKLAGEETADGVTKLNDRVEELEDGGGAVGDALEKHIADQAPHVSAEDRERWDNPPSGVPADHNHTIAQVTNLQTTLDGKAPTTHSHTAGQLPRASTSEKGILQLNNTLTSTSTTDASTAAVAKALADRGKLLWEGSWDGSTTLTVPGLLSYQILLFCIGNKLYYTYLGKGNSDAKDLFTGVFFGFVEGFDPPNVMSDIFVDYRFRVKINESGGLIGGVYERGFVEYFSESGRVFSSTARYRTVLEKIYGQKIGG